MLRLAPSRVGGQGLLLESWSSPQAGRPTPSTVEPTTLIMMSARPAGLVASRRQSSPKTTTDQRLRLVTVLVTDHTGSIRMSASPLVWSQHW